MIEKLKTDILAAAKNATQPVIFVAVDGHGGAGKTTLAKALSRELSAGVIHTDDFASWDNAMDWWPRLVAEVFEPIRHGATTISYQRGSWYKNHRPSPVINQPVESIMIIEGVSSSRKEFQQYLSYSIWVETPKEICFERGIARDGEDKRAEWEKLHEYEDEYVARDDPMSRANITINGTIDIYGKA